MHYKCAKCGRELYAVYIVRDGRKFCFGCGGHVVQCAHCLELFSEYDTHTLLTSGRKLCRKCGNRQRIETERVLCAALWCNNGKEPDVASPVIMHGPDAVYDPKFGPQTTGVYAIGRRHSDAFSTLDRITGGCVEADIVQGFVTTAGRFLTHEDAKALAERVGQIHPGADGVLASEDLY